MFMGEFNHTIDNKNRVIVPARFRDGLGDRFVVCAGLDGCLYLYPMKDWEEFAAGLMELPFTKEARELQRHFMQSASECELDKQGRILIPGKLRSFAGLIKDVVFVGVIGKIELWDPERLEAGRPDATMEDIAERMSTEYGLSF
ncbi:MAG: division/cell wall cluster transcriptional repressor MraZ [Lachnospiraceae bacterium]|nr:division/cell wall cluster transcriptional repressor MraZ [Lachnospiraceae bacterium]